jgi:hypothetical protein
MQTTSFREKDELLLVLTQARLSIFSPAGEPIPSSIALFLAHCTSLIGQPDSPLYPAFQRFLLQRATVDLRDVPMFYIMLYSSNTDEFAAAPREERRWMVRFLTEGLVRSQVRRPFEHSLRPFPIRGETLMVLDGMDRRTGRSTVVVKSSSSLPRSSRRAERILKFASSSSKFVSSLPSLPPLR